jgi:hypothetical protein
MTPGSGAVAAIASALTGGVGGVAGAAQPALPGFEEAERRDPIAGPHHAAHAPSPDPEQRIAIAFPTPADEAGSAAADSQAAADGPQSASGVDPHSAMGVDRPSATGVDRDGMTGPPHAPGPDPEELYEHFLERLRHDLLAERERLGSLIPELPE